jgi:aminoglycoside phosphotransferase (APT) family kinase protein
MPVWSAEVEIDERLVRGLLGQFGLENAHLRKLAEGWDNSVWVADGRYAFRFPHRAVAIPGVERELAVLPKLAPLLPLPVPRPVFAGEPAGEYPWPFFGCELIPGVEAGDAELDDEGRVAVGLELASFLRELHAVELDVELPHDPNGREDMPKRIALAREELGELERLGVWQAPPELGALLEGTEHLPPPERPVVAHGDLHFRHLLVEGGSASGVIDWGDVCRADPAIDLPLYWSFVPPGGREAFLDTYGPVNETQLLRARVLAIQLCAVLAHYGHSEDRPAILRAGIDGLERTLR